MRFLHAGALVVAGGSGIAVLLAGCGTTGGAQHAAPATMTSAAVAKSTVAPPASAGYSAAKVGAGPPDGDGNPACPVADSWGAGAKGVAVSYWGHGADFVTVLVRANSGPDVARSLHVEDGQALQLFEFPDADPSTVREVLIITNESRCYATVDQNTFRR